ncbi:hypothetical protein GN956_G6033 [Arapaima gigas]
MHVVTVVLLSGFSLEVASSRQCDVSEFRSTDGFCCRYPDPGYFILRNCTSDTGIWTQSCKNCTGRKILANCTFLSDTLCETEKSNGTSTWNVYMLLSGIMGPVVITLVLSAVLCGLCIHVKYRSPAKTYLPHYVSKSMQDATIHDIILGTDK